MAAWIQASAFLLLSSVLATTICSVVGGWLINLLFVGMLFPKQRQRTDGLEVIVCGFSRTGTVSLGQALGILGFPCFHGFHMTHPRKAKLFLRAYKYGNPEDWKRLFKGFSAVASFPATCSYKDLAQVFRKAKIILSTRDANKSYNSFSQTVVRYSEGHGYDYMIFKIVTPNIPWCLKKSMYKQCFNGKPEDRDICVKAFLKHNKDVNEHVLPENLLVYDIDKKEGWLSICRFLQVPVPDVPFPKSNVTGSFKDTTTKFAKLYTCVLAIYVIVVSCDFVYIV